MKILFCESSPNLGGQEFQILLQAQTLLEAGHDVRLAACGAAMIATQARQRNIPFIELPFRGSLSLRAVLALRRTLTAFNPDVALGHSSHDANTLAVAARSGIVRPLILRAKTYLSGPVRAFSYNHLFDHTVVPSEYLRRSLLAHPAIRPCKVSVLRPIVDFSRVRSEAQLPLPEPLAARVAQANPLLVHAAMLRGEKGHRVLLDALARIVGRFPQLLLVLAGSGPKEAALRQQVQALGLEKHVYFAGLVSPVQALIAKADLVVMPSLHEPLGMAQIEAMAAGVAVAVSDAGGLPETVQDGHSGWVIRAGDRLAWSEGLQQALSQRERGREMALRGARTVEASYSKAAYLKGLGALIGRAGLAS